MNGNAPLAKKSPHLRPPLKWAGGKNQLLGELLPRIPEKYGRYIEPFFGGGALFFAVAPEKGVISDSNPELVNLYRCIANDVDGVIACLQNFENTEEDFYAVRRMDWNAIPSSLAAARTLYLNRTCYNGLFRVNGAGHFNVPFGHYKKARILDEVSLRATSSLLQKTLILCGDYRGILKEYAEPGDFVFLDPPYLPVSEYADFRRYTKEQFNEEDHRDLAREVDRLQSLGCHVILTNSDHPLVHDLYRKYRIDTVFSRRQISCKGNSRSGRDAIVVASPDPAVSSPLKADILPVQLKQYPATRFMGSKNKLLGEIWSVASHFRFESVVDLFSGSGVVGYLFKVQGKTVLSNDHMAMSATFARAMIENGGTLLPEEEALMLLKPFQPVDRFVERTFGNLYFSDDDNRLIDVLRANIKAIRDPLKQAIARSALIRACLKKRPRGVFTYVGQRYDDGRRDLSMPFDRHFLEAVRTVNGAVFDNGRRNCARHGDAMTLDGYDADLVYIDPPYYTPLSDNAYVRRYHFVEGLALDWEGVQIQEETVTRKFRSYPTPFSSRIGAQGAFEQLFGKFRESILLVSYSSNGYPTLPEMLRMMRKYKKHVEVVPVNYRYSFGNRNFQGKENKNVVREYLFVGF